MCRQSDGQPLCWSRLLALGSTDQTRQSQNGASHVRYHRTRLNAEQEDSTLQTSLDTGECRSRTLPLHWPPRRDPWQPGQPSPTCFTPSGLLLCPHCSPSPQEDFLLGFIEAETSKTSQKKKKKQHFDLQLCLLSFWPSPIITPLDFTSIWGLN